MTRPEIVYLLSTPVAVLLMISVVGWARGRLSLENPEIHAIWFGIMALTAILTWVIDRLYINPLFHAADMACLSFCVVLSISSLRQFFETRANIARHEADVPFAPVDEGNVTWQIVNVDTGSVEVTRRMPATWGVPINTYTFSHELWRDGHYVARRAPARKVG